MKIPFSEYQRRGIVPLAGLALAAYYLFVLLPLARRAESLDEPLQKAWQKLSVSLDQTNATAIDFLHITNQLSETRQALLILENAKQQATARLQLGAAVRAKMHADFELVEYENERSRQLEELGNLAKQQQVAVEPAVFASFPEHTADVKQPALLWAACRSPTACSGPPSSAKSRPSTRSRCRQCSPMRPPPTAPSGWPKFPCNSNSPPRRPAPSGCSSVCRCAPTKSGPPGLPEAPADKPPLFVDRLVVQKQSPDKPDEVHVWLRAVGFVLRE